MQQQLLDYSLNFIDSPIYRDNGAALQIIKNPVQHSKTKHIDIRIHIIRDCFERKLIHLEKIIINKRHQNLIQTVGTLAIKRIKEDIFSYMTKNKKDEYDHPPAGTTAEASKVVEDSSSESSSSSSGEEEIIREPEHVIPLLSRAEREEIQVTDYVPSPDSSPKKKQLKMKHNHHHHQSLNHHHQSQN
ncbi:hypothetical protein E3N88_17926 [Mikania micrantha]|uniref:Uncharacterized protein n=1 Tax=Mikania micrantha TaxID=192012 RepID=A0A5N6NUN3_9ASTR|nr:hypothetical protein E3N88_17926 [Mikania micrantha]